MQNHEIEHIQKEYKEYCLKRFQDQAKAYEEMLELELSENLSKVSSLKSQIFDLTNELAFYKQKYQSNEVQILNCSDEIESLTNKLKNLEKKTQNLEQTNDCLETKLRNLQFYISDLEEKLYSAQEINILLKNEADLTIDQKNIEIQRLKEIIKDLQNPNTFEAKNNKTFVLIGIISCTSPCIKYTEKTISVNCNRLSKVFSFDNVFSCDFFEFLRVLMNKQDQNVTLLCYGFKNIMQGIEKYKDLINDFSYTCIEFFQEKNNLQYKTLSKNDLKLYSSLKLRKKKFQFIHKIQQKNFSLQIIDLNDDTISKNLFKEILFFLNNEENDCVYNKIIDKHFEKIGLVFDISSKDPVSALNLAFEMGNNGQFFKNKENSVFSDKKDNERGLIITKQKKEIFSLNQKIVVLKEKEIKSHKKIKNKENELEKEISRLKKQTDELSSLIKKMSINEQSKSINGFNKSISSFMSVCKSPKNQKSPYNPKSPNHQKSPLFNGQRINKPSRVPKPKCMSLSDFELENLIPNNEIL